MTEPRDFVRPAPPSKTAGSRSAWRSIAFAILGAVALAVGLLDLTRGGSVNPALPPAEVAAQDIAVVSASVYVSLRAINAALSAAQEVEIGASIGAQASFQPLKVLEPVDDTVERVADVVFAVAAGAAMVTVGLEPVAAIGLVVLGAGLIGLAGAGYAPSASVAAASLRAVRLGAALGLILPLVFAGGVWLGERATMVQWNDAVGRLNAVAGEAQVLIGTAEAEMLADAPEDSGFFSGLLGTLNDATASVQSYVAAAGVFTQQADALFTATLTIIGIFILRTLVLPILLMWSVMAVLRKSIA
ncbi:hypothetical protein [Gymnodinialimonas ceratoperidinii]|uniref:hypothetical protein n=1 Tax=Gymnodinialimonas ceratoperidinii TaxID=2856823 RepID=UPI001FFCE6E7|nr:hypothetical protein [Gymnodinialimonas ceratoperidinii]